MKATPLIPIILAGTLLGAAAQGPQGQQGPPPDPVVASIDKNHDREISSREIKNSAKSLLKLDKDKDGTLSEEELKPEQPKRERRRKNKRGEGGNPPPKRPPSSILNTLDTDSSGDLSKEEIAAAPESLAKLDQDDDGELSSEEAGLGKPGGGGGGPGGGGPPGDGPPPGGPRR